MANIARFNTIDPALDELMRGFFVRPMNYEQQTQQPQLKVEVTENNNAYIVRAEIPGARKEDIDVAVSGNHIEISAEVKRGEMKEGERLLRSERYYGKVYRAFELGYPVDESGTQAKYANGVLELTLAKKTASRAKRISIE